jgi:phage gp16-like protein
MHSRPVEIDRDIVNKLFQLTPALRERSEEEIIKAIKDKKNTDFCGIYELFYHDKLKQECFKIQH